MKTTFFAIVLLATLVSRAQAADPKVFVSVERCDSASSEKAEMSWLIGGENSSSNQNGDLQITVKPYEVSGQARVRAHAQFRDAKGGLVTEATLTAEAGSTSTSQSGTACNAAGEVGKVQLLIMLK